MKAQRVVIASPFAFMVSHSWPWTIALTRALRKFGERAPQVVAYSPSGPVPADLLELVQVVGGESKYPSRQRLLRVRATLVCGWRSLRGDADVIHFVDASLGPLIVIGILARGRRVIYNLWGSPPANLSAARWPRALWARWIRLALGHQVSKGRIALVCETGWIAAEWAELMPRRPAVIGYAVDVAEPALVPKEQARRELGIHEDDKVLLFFGTHRDTKNYDEVIQAAQGFRNPPLLYFAGRVISSNDPEAAAKRHGYPSVRVNDWFIPEEKVPIVFGAVDAVVLPYGSSYNRGTGVLLEACRFGIPVVAARSHYFESFLSRYSCGSLYDEGDLEQLREALRLVLWGSSEDYIRMKAEARRAATENSWESAIASYEWEYQGSVSTVQNR